LKTLEGPAPFCALMKIGSNSAVVSEIVTWP